MLDKDKLAQVPLYLFVALCYEYISDTTIELKMGVVGGGVEGARVPFRQHSNQSEGD